MRSRLRRGESLFRQSSIGFEHQSHRLLKVGSGLPEREALGIGSRQLRDESDAALRHFSVDRGEFDGQGDPRFEFCPQLYTCVTRTGRSRVITIVCSKWAERLPSAVR